MGGMPEGQLRSQAAPNVSEAQPRKMTELRQLDGVRKRDASAPATLAVAVALLIAAPRTPLRPNKTYISVLLLDITLSSALLS